MLIHNYGLFWRREDVFWGKPKVSGTLLGRLSTQLKSDPTDFREQRGIYVLYDERLDLVYVGQTGRGQDRLFKRLSTHNSHNRGGHLAQRWTRFSWFGLRPVSAYGQLEDETTESLESTVTVKTALNQLEAILIAASEPRLNRQGGSFGDAKLYVQERDEQIGVGLNDMVREIHQKT